MSETSLSALTRRSHNIARKLITRLPELRRILATDVVAAYNGDPAAKGLAEIISCYPVIKALTNYRLAHELCLLGVPLIPRMMTEMAHSETGIDIHPGATIGEYFTIDHGTGVVIGETCKIGRNVKLPRCHTRRQELPARRERQPHQRHSTPPHHRRQRGHLCQCHCPGTYHHRIGMCRGSQRVGDTRHEARHTKIHARENRHDRLRIQ